MKNNWPPYKKVVMTTKAKINVDLTRKDKLGTQKETIEGDLEKKRRESLLQTMAFSNCSRACAQ